MYDNLIERQSQVRVGIIGAGGIGSHFCRLLDKMIKENQFGFTRQNITVYDFDVVEAKNTKHQDYTEMEIGVPKATVMTIRYEFSSVIRRFTVDDIASEHIIILCADNPAIRNDVFHNAFQHNKPFIDMRSEGDMVAAFTEKLGQAELLNTLGKDATNDTGVSCQLASDQAENRIRMGNFLVPVMGIEILMKAMRGETYPSKIIRSVV